MGEYKDNYRVKKKKILFSRERVRKREKKKKGKERKGVFSI